jgi:hypothetical protein
VKTGNKNIQFVYKKQGENKIDFAIKRANKKKN